MNQSKVIKEISKLGFNEQLVEKALITNENNSVQTIELLTNLKKKVSPNVSYSYDDYYTDEDYSSDSDHDPLKTLRNNTKFSQTREKILKRNIDSINSIFTKDILFKNDNKQLLENIILNQEMFLKLMTEKKIDNVDRMPCDIDLNDNDNETIKKITALGFSESEVVQAYFACDKDENATLDLLNNNC